MMRFKIWLIDLCLELKKERFKYMLAHLSIKTEICEFLWQKI